MHQVTVPETMKGEKGLVIPSRMSMAYLFKAGRDTSVGPLPKFVSADEPAIYPEITASEFQKEYGVGFNGSPPTKPIGGFRPMQTV